MGEPVQPPGGTRPAAWDELVGDCWEIWTRDECVIGDIIEIERAWAGRPGAWAVTDEGMAVLLDETTLVHPYVSRRPATGGE